MAHILIKGGIGHIGACVVPRLLDPGHQVRVIDRRFPGAGLLPDPLRAALHGGMIDLPADESRAACAAA